MRAIGSSEPFLAFRGKCFQVAADIACRQPEGAQAGKHHMGEVLADTCFFQENVTDRGGDVGGRWVELELVVDAAHQRRSGLEDRPSWGKIRSRVFGEFRAERHHGRGETECAGPGAGVEFVGPRRQSVSFPMEACWMRPVSWSASLR